MMVNFSVSKQHESIGMMMFYYYMRIRANAEMYFRTFASHQTFLTTVWIKPSYFHSFIHHRSRDVARLLSVDDFIYENELKQTAWDTNYLASLGSGVVQFT